MGGIGYSSRRGWVVLLLATGLLTSAWAGDEDDVIPLDSTGLLAQRQNEALTVARTEVWRDWDGSYYINLSTCFGVVNLAYFQRTPQGFRIHKASDTYKGPVGPSTAPPLYQHLTNDRSALLEPNARHLPPFLLRFFGVTLRQADLMRTSLTPASSSLTPMERDTLASSLLIARSPRLVDLVNTVGRQMNLPLEEVATALNGQEFPARPLIGDEGYAFLQLHWALNYMRTHGYHSEAGTIADQLVFSYLPPA